MYKVSCYGCPFTSADNDTETIVCRLTGNPHDQQKECRFAHGDEMPSVEASARILRELQNWRRGHAAICPDPIIVGKAIDIAIEQLEKLTAARE